ncbi:MAG TPA: hypothetical protein QGI71_08585 [Dehalococcoidia bacterium]|nr:hypothetical protein [Dehalococcoidia bacterium]
MKVLTLLRFATGAAAGFAGARTLISREQLPQEIPSTVREPLERASAKLRAARTGATSVLVEVERARAAAEQELTVDYLQRQGRAEPSDEATDEPEALEA